MPFAIGLVLSLLVAMFACRVGLDRDRAFYPTVLIVVALYYVLFGVMSGSLHTVLMEVALMSAFAAAAVVGFRSNLWIVAAGLAGHGLLDLVHGNVLHNSGGPAWWPAFCAAYDLGAAGILAWMIKEKKYAVR
jgi:hypothetical protein